MRKLLNTLYVTTPEAYLSLDGENVVILKEDSALARFPLHNLESIVTFGYTGASPALMGKCAESGISLSFCTASGRFLADVKGETHGNVVLRRIQYRYADDEAQSLSISKNILIGKLHNSRWVLKRATRDYPQRIDTKRVKNAAKIVANAVSGVQGAKSSGELMGVEGEAASTYFSAFDELILTDKKNFFFRERNRRPPLDNVNALLSYVYTLLSYDTASALSTVGLDPFVGFLHKDRPGRRSLALDMMEELRAPLADRFVLTLINNRQINHKSFEVMENGAVLLKADGRKDLLSAWQNRKRETIIHPFLKEKIEWGLVPYAQALLLARFLRGDLDGYPPFLWK
ncbi:MAG: type I-C CRISPR-associated endonuclease Cas1c [Clostridiales bacterium]|jgi:CRISPR-associated protein Cas1|nr:type I-C CRISPR-associated endonuclease Cas1c [Clostridiales bacterium]